jgi:hypothetical protein
MAATSLFSARTTDGVSSGVAATGSSVIIEVQNDSVMGGAELTIEQCSVDTTGKYAPVGYVGLIKSPIVLQVQTVSGMYIRVRQSKSGGTTSTNVVLNQ